MTASKNTLPLLSYQGSNTKPLFDIYWFDEKCYLKNVTPMNPIVDSYEKEHNKETTGLDLLNLANVEMDCLLEPFLQRVGIATLAGSSDTGKSTLLRQLAIDVSLGHKQSFGFKLNAKHSSAIFVATEDLPNDIAYMLRKQVNQDEHKPMVNLRFVFELENLKIVLTNMLERKPADLIVIDCLADAFGGDLKDTTKIRSFLHPYQEIALKFKCLILFLHHTGKRTENLEPNKNNLLSGQGLEAKMRLVIELRIDPVVPNKRHLCIVKGNYLPAHFKNESYNLEFNDKSFLFQNTGDRTPFEQLIKGDDKEKLKFFESLKLEKQNITQEEIAKKLGYAAKSSVSKLLTKGKKLGWEKTSTEIAG